MVKTGTTAGAESCLAARGLSMSAIGIILLSFDTVLIRLAGVPAWEVSFWRGALIALTTSAILYARERKTFIHKIAAEKIPLLVSGMLWGSSGVLFVVSVKMTVAANVLVMLSLSPVFAAAAAYFLLGEKISRGSIVMTAIGAAGVFIIFSGDVSAGNVYGNFLGLLVPVCLGSNLAWMRKHRSISRTASVITGGVFAAIVSLFFAKPFSVPAGSFIYLALLGLVAIPLAQLLLSTGTRFIPAPQVALIMMMETVLGPLWVWLFTGEVPPYATFTGGALIIAGVASDSVISIARGRKML